MSYDTPAAAGDGGMSGHFDAAAVQAMEREYPAFAAALADLPAPQREALLANFARLHIRLTTLSTEESAELTGALGELAAGMERVVVVLAVLRAFEGGEGREEATRERG